MAEPQNEAIFYDDWIACLCAHYLYTLEVGDTANALGLRRVLLDAGVTDAQIDTLAPLPREAEPAPLETETQPEAVESAVDEVRADLPYASTAEVEISPEIPETPIANAIEPAVEPELTPDYPGKGKAKSKKPGKPPVQQPTLF